MLDILIDALLDSAKLLPFLYLTYLLMEFMEHKMSSKVKSAIRNAGKFGPAAGAVLGAFPQCGFSAAAANLYAGRIITLGTLIAIFLSTSDEMLPILIMNRADISLVLTLVGTKIVIGLVAGFVIDALVRKKRGTVSKLRIGNICEQERCNCSRNIWLSSLKHTVVVIAFIFIIAFALNFIMEEIGEEVIANVVGNQKILAPMVAGIIGLIPNCASSVALTQLYVSGVTSMGTLLAGLLAGSGVGILVLFRINNNLKENFKILGIIYGIGVLTGIILNIAGI
ncbi:MAG: putative manganese transporter [Lachnospiraceae bacterium]